MTAIFEYSSRPIGACALALGIQCLAAQPRPALADETVLGAEPAERWAVHGQMTFVEQAADAFHAPYAGPNSLSPHTARETLDATLFLGTRLWPGAEGWISPEIDQGFGLDDTLGVAGFPSGEAYKVGKSLPYLRVPRAFVRQTVGLGGGERPVESDTLQLAGSVSADRLVFTVGKFAVTDIFDTNRYAHDPRADFLNWSAIDAGTFDYAADAWGFTVGAAAEWYQGSWTLRAGVFDLSTIPNSPHLDPGGHEFQLVTEVEKRHELLDQPGRVLVTAYDSRGRMGLLNSAVEVAQAAGGPVDIAAVRQYRSRLGVSADLEQQIASDLGLFARAGKAAGNVEAYEFTDMDRTVTAGLSLKGSRWRRAADTVGVAAMDNGISATRERYLNAGGLGILVGDGRLPHPANEHIVEAYYDVALTAHANLTLDLQRIENPAYNADRGPVSVVAVRLHAQF